MPVTMQAACAPFIFAPCDKVHIYRHNYVMVEYSTFTECSYSDSFESDHHLCTCCFICAKVCKCGRCDAFLSQLVHYELRILIFV